MKNKLKFLISVSLKRKIKTKWFAIANIILALAIIGIINIDGIIQHFGGDFNKKINVYVIDNTNKAYNIFDDYLIADEESNYVLKQYTNTKDESIAMLQNEKTEKDSIVIVFDDDEENVLKVTLITNEFLDLMDFPVITTAINNTKVVMAIAKHNITQEEITALTTGVDINREILNEENSTEENMNMIMSTVFPIVILPFFMLVIFLVQMIGAEINDEKTTKGMEIIISNVSPKVHFFSKVIAGNLFVIIQGLLLVAYFVIGLLVKKTMGGTDILTGELLGSLSGSLPTDFINSLAYLIPLVLILMLITMVGYSLLAGILSSMTTNIEDYQQIQTPIMLISLLGYYLAIMAGVFKGALFIKVLSFVPFISAILSPSLFILGQITILDFVISILLMGVTVYLLAKFGLKVYKVGILNYSSGGMFKRMLNALKSKD